MCFNAQQLEAGIFNIASFDGELIHAQYNKPDGDENADYIKSSVQVCVCSVLCVCVISISSIHDHQE